MEDLKLTLIQADLYWEQRDKNLEQLGEKIKRIGTDTDLILLPETFTTGFSMNAEKLAEPMDGRAMQWMADRAAEQQVVLSGSLIIKEAGHYYNRLIWMRPDGSYEQYNKRHLFSLAEEDAHFTAGDERLIVNLKGWRFCPLICYDLRFPVWSRNREEYDCLIYVANWPERRNYAWKQLLIARAIENQCYTVGVNRVGEDGEGISCSGDSVVLNAMGEKMSDIKAHEEQVVTVALSYRHLEELRKKLPFLHDGDSFELHNQAPG